MSDVVLSSFYTLMLNGIELDIKRKLCIQSIDLSENCDGSDTLTFVVSDPEFLFLNDNIFVEEVTVSLAMGWNEDTYTVDFNGFISAIDPDFPEDGTPTLSIFCLDNSHVMNRTKKKRSWDKVTRPDVVKKIAQEYGFKFVSQAGYNFTVEDTISQSNKTDIKFIEDLAGEEREPFICKLIGDSIHYIKKGLLAEPSTSVFYKQYPYDVNSFTPKINKETRQESVSKADINTDTKKVESATANDSETSRDTQGDAVKTSSKISNKKYDPVTKTWNSI